jgi:dTDP-N-acetylfucosamine:lipid II N-acetylfucosaminyltransferase
LGIIKHLHVMNASNYSVVQSYIRFVNEEFEKSNHIFIIRDSVDNPAHNLEGVNNILWLPFADKQNRRELFQYLKQADRVYWHNMQWSSFTQLLLLLQPNILKKTMWIAWGGDLYNWKKEDNSLKGFVSNAVKLELRKRVKIFIGIFPPDINYFKSTFRSEAQTFYASYVGGLDNPIFKKELNLTSLKEKEQSNSCINIQIGHSSTRVLNHIAVLDNLAKFKDENIKIYIPLSYGDKEYGDQVEETAKLLFGDKAICIREIMELETYMDFLSTIDIAIFNTLRQIGLGNVNPLLYMEKKIFMPAGSVMYDYYKSLNIDICDYQQLQKQDFNSFIEPVDMSNAKHYIKLIATNKDEKIKMWSKVFNAPMK